MKVKVIKKSYTDVMAMKRPKHKRPIKPSILFRTLMRLVSIPDLIKTGFRLEKVGMERLGKKEPCLVLMNHSSFIDLEIVASAMYPRPFNIVATTDSYFGKGWLMRRLGCIPTKKFVNEPSLVRDMIYAIRELGDSVILFPEAGYSFDGKSTTLPDTLGRLVKMLGAPVVMITTYGAFSRDPLYNNLKKRSVKVSAKQEFLLSKEDIASMSTEQINEIITEKFSFDSFRWQQENKIRIAEPTRAEGLNRVLYKCPHCEAEGFTEGTGTQLVCHNCGESWTLDEYGYINSNGKKDGFNHIPDWYSWERECVRREICDGKYGIDIPVDIYMSTSTSGLYSIGEGRLAHSQAGFKLVGKDIGLDYEQKPLASYSVCSDFNWYEISDIVAIGNKDAIFYCLPKIKNDIVAKIRLAAEEIYKLARPKRT